MTQKIYDIFPPGVRKEKELFIKDQFESYIFLKKWIIVLLLFFIFLAGVFLYFKLSRVYLRIWPKMEPLNFTEEITVNKNVKKIDVLNKIIPGEIFEETKELWQEFEATGKVLQQEKARGRIKVFNKYNPPTPITLRAKTRFLSDGGKYFISPKKIYIPPAKIKKGKIIPSFVEIEVVAIEAGEDYNIAPAKFSIPGLVGTPYYYTVYGESTNSMKGGFKKEVRKVSEEDIKRAENTMRKRLFKALEDSLKNKLSSDFILLNNAILKEVIESTPLVKAGNLVSQFNFNSKAKVKALIFKKSDLESFVKKLISAKISDSKTLFEKSLEIDYFPQRIDIRNGLIILNLKIRAEVYYSIDKKELFDLIKGKREKEIKDNILKGFSEKISKVEVELWPFWVRRAPQKIEKVRLRLILD